MHGNVPRSPKRLVVIALGVLALAGLLVLTLRRANLGPRVLPTAYDSTAVAFSPDNRLLATGHGMIVRNREERWAYGSGMLQLRRMPDGTITRTLPFPERTVRQQDWTKSVGALGWMTFSPDGALLLASNYSNNSVGVLEIATGRWLFLRNGQRSPSRSIYRPIGFSKDGGKALYLRLEPAEFRSGGGDAGEKVVHKTWLVACDARTGKVVAERPRILGPGEWPMRLLLLPDGRTIACATKLGDDASQYGFEGKLLLIDARTGKRQRVARLDYTPIELACSPDGATLATLDGDGTARLSSLQLTERGRSLRRKSGPGKFRTFPGGRWLAFSPDGRLLAGASRDGIAIWDTRDLRTTRFIRDRGKWAWAEDLAFSPDGKTLAVADKQKSIALWPIAPPAK